MNKAAPYKSVDHKKLVFCRIALACDKECIIQITNNGSPPYFLLCSNKLQMKLVEDILTIQRILD